MKPFSEPMNKQRAFTLVELLVVMAVIAILAALILPALSAAKAKSKSIVCVGNLRQLAFAVSLYANEHRQRLPIANTISSKPLNPDYPRIYTVLAPYLGYQTNNPPPEKASVFYCPGDDGSLPPYYYYYPSEWSSYEWFALVNGQLMTDLQLGTNRVSPAAVLLLFDYERFHFNTNRFGLKSSSRGKNACYADGHAGPYVDPGVGPPAQ